MCFYIDWHSCCIYVLVLCCSDGCLLCMLCFLHLLYPFICWNCIHKTSVYKGRKRPSIFQVASLRVFQVVGLIYIVFGIVAKIGAVFVTIPYSVVGGMMMINFGVLIGVMLSNMQFIDMNSTRNLAAIGVSMLMAEVIPYWIETTPNAISTGTVMRTIKLNLFPVPVRLHSGSGILKVRCIFTIFCDI